MLLRMIDFLKGKRITALMTSLTDPAGPPEQSNLAMSSLVDAWVLLRNIESGGQRNRCLYILKARGLSHSNKIREFLLTDHGVDLVRHEELPSKTLDGDRQEIEKSRSLNVGPAHNVGRRRGGRK